MDPSQAWARVFAVYGHRCRDCGRSDLPLEVHHVNSDKTDNRITNLVPPAGIATDRRYVSRHLSLRHRLLPQPDRPLSLVDDFDRRAVAAARTHRPPWASPWHTRASKP